MKYPLKKQMKRLAGSLPRQRKGQERNTRRSCQRQMQMLLKAGRCKENDRSGKRKALNDLRASVTGLAMTATAKLLSEQAGPESDKKRYQAFLASAGEKHD